MSHVETRLSGQRILRYESGRQPLLVASAAAQEVMWLSSLDEVLRLRRHWVDAIASTEVCHCQPPCGTMRIDRLVAVIKNQGEGRWEERLMILPEDGWRSCERIWLLNYQDRPDLRGVTCIVQRVGERRNGRTTCIPQAFQSGDLPATFDVPAAARHQLHVAADFFGAGCNELEEDEKVIVPARSRQTKPRVPLGKKPQG